MTLPMDGSSITTRINFRKSIESMDRRTTQHCSLLFRPPPFRSIAGMMGFACWAIVGVVGSVVAEEPKPVTFSRDIKPVLKRLCVGSVSYTHLTLPTSDLV